MPKPLSHVQRVLLRQTAAGQVKHRGIGDIEAWWAPNARGYTHRVNRTAESLLRIGLVARGTEPQGDPQYPYFTAVVTDAGAALLVALNQPEGH